MKNIFLLSFILIGLPGFCLTGDYLAAGTVSIPWDWCDVVGPSLDTACACTGERDVNKDGVCNILDALLIARFSAGLINSF